MPRLRPTTGAVKRKKHQPGPLPTGPREARVLPGQLTLPFDSSDSDTQRKKAELRQHSAADVPANGARKETYVYQYMRWLNR